MLRPLNAVRRAEHVLHHGPLGLVEVRMPIANGDGLSTRRNGSIWIWSAIMVLPAPVSPMICMCFGPLRYANHRLHSVSLMPMRSPPTRLLNSLGVVISGPFSGAEEGDGQGHPAQALRSATTTDVYMQEIPESKTVDARSAELRLLPIGKRSRAGRAFCYQMLPN
jgi:hypothetical protein